MRSGHTAKPAGTSQQEQGDPGVPSSGARKPGSPHPTGYPPNSDILSLADLEVVSEAIQHMALALTNHSHVWSSEERMAYERAMVILDGLYP